jgi:pyruvate/2-oxoglutarate dehydrogenase complex dihydrolipoamide acyltransferase (E2) component
MANEFRLPDLGEGVTEGEIVRLMVAEGDHVKEDQPLMEVETDKAAVEIPSPHSGIVTRVHVAEKQVVNVGDVMITFGEAGDVADAGAAAVSEPKPAARAAPAATTATRSAGTRTKPASPAVRKLARTLGVDLESIEGSGPGGRVLRDDVERAASSGGSPAPAKTPAPARPAAAAGTAGKDAWGPTRREAVTRARRTIAETMARSASTVPHVTDCDDADVTDLDRLRRGYQPPDGVQRKLTILPFVVKATALALRRHLIFNASYDQAAGEIVWHDYVSIAIGVHTDRGLIAPVIRNVDKMSIAETADALADVADRARRAAFEVNDTRGGTFTISNAGAMGGSRYSTPIINPPQSAILALGRTRQQPWVVEGAVVPRLILPLSLSFDHRIIDGAAEVLFMQEIIGQLENPARLLV